MPTSAPLTRKPLGHGVGLRTVHFEHLLAHPPEVDFFEIISENFLMDGGRPLAVLEKVRREVPVTMHGVSLSLGGTDPLNRDHLAALKRLAGRIEPAWLSDHLCWGTAHGNYLHDLLPLPYTEEALANLVERIGAVQEFLGRRILVENVSSYVTFLDSGMSEWEFLSETARRADCGILLDINNIFVSAMNHGFDPADYLAGVPADRVMQFHLAGHSVLPEVRLDTHDAPVCDEVWALYDAAVRRFGAVPSLIEWDDKIPPYPDLVAASREAAARAARALAPRATPGPAR